MVRPRTLSEWHLSTAAQPARIQEKLELTPAVKRASSGVRAIWQRNADHEARRPGEEREECQWEILTNRETEALIACCEPSRGAGHERHSVGEGDRTKTVKTQRRHRSDSSLSQTPPAFPASSVTIEAIMAIRRDGQVGLSLRMRWLY